MLDSFLIRAALAGIGIALAAGPLGCFIVWRRMAYFGEATAHASVLGIALSLAISAPIFYGALLVSLAMAVIVSSLSSRGYAMDTLLGVVAHSALASGLVAVSFISGIRIDVMAFLFGDILAVNKQDLLLICHDVEKDLSHVIWEYKISYKENKIYAKSSDWADSSNPIIFEDDDKLLTKSYVLDTLSFYELIFYKNELIIEEALKAPDGSIIAGNMKKTCKKTDKLNL